MKVALSLAATLCACAPQTMVMREATARGALEGTAVAAPAGRVLFISDRDGNSEIYAALPDGSRLERLTYAAEDDFLAPVGPEGQLLGVRRSGENEGAREWLMPLQDGVAMPASRLMRNPSWLADGRVVVESDLESFRDLYLIDPSGAVSRLTRCASGCYEPSAAGEMVAYASADDGDEDIYAVSLRTFHTSRLTWGRGSDSAPALSPDGRKILFSSTRAGAARIFVMDADGSHPHALRPASEVEADLAAERDAVWSPDGSAIALVVQRQGRASLRIVRAADGAEIAGSDGPWIDQQPAWSPDGRFIAFVSNRDGDDDIFVMQRDGRVLGQLTHEPSAEWLPRWAP